MMSHVHIYTIPIEVRAQIWNLCLKEDLKNLSLSNKWMYADVKPFLWKQLTVSWNRVEQITKESQSHKAPSQTILLSGSSIEQRHHLDIKAIKRHHKPYFYQDRSIGWIYDFGDDMNLILNTIKSEQFTACLLWSDFFDSERLK